MLAKILDLFGFLRFVSRRWSDDRCPQIAGSLTYTTLLALVPMFAIAVAVLSSAPFFEDVMSKIKIFLLLNLTPDIAGRIITVYMKEFAANASRLTKVGVGFDTSGSLWPGTNGGQVVFKGPLGNVDTLMISAIGMVFHP